MPVRILTGVSADCRLFCLCPQNFAKELLVITRIKSLYFSLEASSWNSTGNNQNISLP